MSKISVEAATARESLRQLGFRVSSDTGAHRLLRSDGSQAQLYRLDGKLDVIGHLGNVNDLTSDQAAIQGLAKCKLILADEADRLTPPRHVFGASLGSSAK